MTANATFEGIPVGFVVLTQRECFGVFSDEDKAAAFTAAFRAENPDVLPRTMQITAPVGWKAP